MTTPKSRILYIQRFLETKTDENNPVIMQQILDYLKSMGISASRRAVASDIQQLMEFGVDIVCNTGRRNEYFIGDRQFELPELKLLADAVQASKFISAKKSRILIDKLSAHASVHQAGEFHRQLYVDKQVKPSNEKVYITVDLLHTTIHAGRQMWFKYYEYNREKKKVYKHKRKVYEFSPYAMIWNNDRYYTVGYSASHGKVITFRVDRIAAPQLTDIPAMPMPADFDMAAYAKSVFQMYDGPIRDVTLKCENTLMNTIVDRFGEDVDTCLLDEQHFCANVNVSTSPTFFGWLFMFMGKMEILAPEDVAQTYAALVRCVHKKD